VKKLMWPSLKDQNGNTKNGNENLFKKNSEFYNLLVPGMATYCNINILDGRITRDVNNAFGSESQNGNIKTVTTVTLFSKTYVTVLLFLSPWLPF
jgi:hypothetical protein